MFAPNIIHCELTYVWYAKPKFWRCFLVKVDDNFARCEHFTVEAATPETALAGAMDRAATHKFSTPVEINLLDIQIEI